MLHISQLGTQIREKTTYPDILVISRRFGPQLAAMGEYVYNRCLQDPERVIVLTSACSGDKAFDKAQQFPVYRWPFPSFFHIGFLEKIFSSCFNVLWSVLLAINLYFRYHYRYIEWCYGYDFPALLILSYLLPIRFFIYLHGQDIARVNSNPLWRSLFKLTLKRAAGIVCNSCYTRDYLRNSFRLNTPIHIITLAVRPEKFGNSSSPIHLDNLRLQLRQIYNIPETAIVILSVGKLVKDKNLDRVIENLPLLLNFGVDVHYIICGLGPCTYELQSLAHRLRVDKRVHFAGYVPQKELAGYYAACDIFTILSNAVETFGMAYLEASYFGKPILASRSGSILDVVRHEENGILVNINSGYEVFQAFLRLCQDSALRENLGRQGKELTKPKNLHRWLYKPESSYSCLLF